MKSFYLAALVLAALLAGGCTIQVEHRHRVNIDGRPKLDVTVRGPFAPRR